MFLYTPEQFQTGLISAARSLYMMTHDLTTAKKLEEAQDESLFLIEFDIPEQIVVVFLVNKGRFYNRSNQDMDARLMLSDKI